jgi:hypothetical protein
MYVEDNVPVLLADHLGDAEPLRHAGAPQCA